ncbi:hypothetical protein [Streptomyces sp. TE12347]
MVKTGAVITIVASVAGLLTTGVATLTSSMVASDQLKQSKEVDEEKRREQAARVSYWVDIQPNGTSRLHLMNRSPDPISSVWMRFTAAEIRDNLVETEGYFSIGVPSIPPCSDLVFASKDMRYNRRERARASADMPLSEPPPSAEWLSYKHALIEALETAFIDRNGVRWRRHKGLLTRIEGNPQLDLDPPRRSWQVRRGAVLATQPQPLESCADAVGLSRPGQ